MGIVAVLTVDSYYTGYAKFFDVTDDSCDKVTWHIYNELRTRAYLTQEKRQQMNDLVDLMNNAIRSAVERAGPNVHFIDYDKYVGMTDGRFCQPGDDESKGQSANRRDVFFYEMKTEDEPYLSLDDGWHTELKRRESGDDVDDAIKNNTLGARYGARIQETVDSGDLLLTIDKDNTPNGLESIIEDYRYRKNKAKGRYTINGGNLTHVPSTRLLQNSSLSSGVESSSVPDPNITNSEIVALERLSFGETIALLIPDSFTRAFHPTQEGHILIANLILYTMSAVNAESIGMYFSATPTVQPRPLPLHFAH
jgi:hypothetical protein